MEWPCSRDFSAANFGNGLQDYPFDVNEPDVWFPDKTYMRGTFTVSGAATVGEFVVPPTVEQQIALTEGCFANCYNQASFKIGGADLCSIDSFFPQASALEARVNNSGAWMDENYLNRAPGIIVSLVLSKGRAPAPPSGRTFKLY